MRLIRGPQISPQQAERLQEAINARRMVHPDHAPEWWARMESTVLKDPTGTGFPDFVVDRMISTILGHDKQREATTGLLKALFGDLPRGVLEALGPLVAVSALCEQGALDLLATLVDEEPREVYETRDGLTNSSARVLNRCTERTEVLSPRLKQVVKDLVSNLAVIAEDRQLFGRDVWSVFSQGQPPGEIEVLVTAGDDSSDSPTLIERVEESANLALTLRQVINECRLEQVQRLSAH